MTREEAIQIIRDIYHTDEEMKALESLIPELRESEDERIIQFFAELATDACGGPGQEYYEELGLNYDKVMAWLEKQKEQKSAEKQDYSELNDIERAIHRGFLSAGVENVPVTIIKETAQEYLAQMKPAEWSKEDEKMYTIMNSVIKSNIGDTSLSNYIDRENLFKLKNWLENRFKLLRPIKQEWSEEDERIRKVLCGHFSTGPGDCQFRDTKLSNRQITAFLKSLRPKPHWKPSEEQMYALAKAVTLYGGGLDSLYQDLKKLM